MNKVSIFSKEQPFDLTAYDWAFEDPLNKSIRIIGDQLLAEQLSLRIQKSPTYSYQVYTVLVNPVDHDLPASELKYELTIAITSLNTTPPEAQLNTKVVCCATPAEAVGYSPELDFLQSSDWVMLKHIAAALIKANLLPQEAVELEAKRVKARAALQ
jgi:hypothetical protein